MNRTELAALANPKSMLDAQSAAVVAVEADPLEDRLRAYFATDAGKADLDASIHADNRRLTLDEAVAALLEEARGMKT